MEESLLRAGVVGSSANENEWRLLARSDHLPLLDEIICKHSCLKEGYAARHGLKGDPISRAVMGTLERRERDFAIGRAVEVPEGRALDRRILPFERGNRPCSYLASPLDVPKDGAMPGRSLRPSTSGVA